MLATGAILGFTMLDGPRALGAHPLWAVTVGLVGTGIGLVMWIALHLLGTARRKMVTLGACLLVAAAAMAWIGKLRFVASFAEDQLAGRMWFVGWIVLLAAVALLIASLVNPDRRSARQGLTGGKSGS